MKEDTAFNSVNIIIGFIVLSISIIVLILPNAVILSLIILLSIAIMASGVARTYNAFEQNRKNLETDYWNSNFSGWANCNYYYLY